LFSGADPVVNRDTLQLLAEDLRSKAYAESTKKAYSVHLKTYLTFCEIVKVAPVPLSQSDLSCYVAYLSTKICYSSIRQYLNIVKIIHLEAGFKNPLEDSWHLSSLLKETRRSLGDRINPKLPITIEILWDIFDTINLCSDFEVCFWAACLVAFFSFLRKSNLLISTHAAFDRHLDLCREDFEFNCEYMLIEIRRTKTIQFGQRPLITPSPLVPGSPLCPAATTKLLFRRCPAPTDAPGFSYRGAGGNTRVLTYPEFLGALKLKLYGLGLDASQYGGHSFRRGGASSCFFKGNVSADQIKLHGDWASQAYQRYLLPDMESKLQVAHAMKRMVMNYKV